MTDVSTKTTLILKKYLTFYCFGVMKMTNEANEKYSWDPQKRELLIKTRGLDFVELADVIFDDPNVAIEPDNSKNCDEVRYLAFALVNNMRLCLCFSLRDNKKHLITIFKMREKKWRKYYGNNC